MGLLELVNTTETKRYEHESGDWLEVKANVSKRELNALLKSMPTSTLVASTTDDITMSAVVDTSEALFKALVVGWSLDVEPTVDNYLSLTGPAAGWIDGVLFKHFNEVQLSKDELGKPSTSPRGQRKAPAKTA